MPLPVNSNTKEATEKDPLLDLDKDFADYKEVAQGAIKACKSNWDDEVAETEVRRELRKLSIDSDAERKKHNLEADEAFCPVRLADTNINREQAKYAAYLTKSNRSAILTAVEDETVDCTVEEKIFTQKSRYNGWEIAPLKAIDGMQTHGWDYLEVLFDIEKSGHFTLEHVGHENLIFPTDCKDFQSNDFMVRLVEYTNKDLIKFAKTKGWNKEQVAKVIAASTNSKTDANSNDSKYFKLNKIEKVFFRGVDDFIYVAWSCSEHCDDWLRAPKLLYNGKCQINKAGVIEKLYETAYPIEPLLYSISENELLMKVQGRVSMDEHKQEAATLLLSSFVTGHRRAAQPYFSTDGVNDGTTLEEAQTNIKLKPGRVFNKSLKQFQLTPPDTGLLAAINTLIGQSQMESGDVAYAVQSNKSTRKTAAEVNLAKNENDLLSTVQVSLLSIALRNVYTRCFDIFYTRVKCGLIKVPKEVMDRFSQYSYILKPAGDVDVIERQQKQQMMMQAWPVYKGTPCASTFLKNLTKILFPEEAAQYIAEFEKDDVRLEALKRVTTVLESIVSDGQGGLKPEFQMYAKEFGDLETMLKTAMSPLDGNNKTGSVSNVPGSVENVDTTQQDRSVDLSDTEAQQRLE